VAARTKRTRELIIHTPNSRSIFSDRPEYEPRNADDGTRGLYDARALTSVSTQSWEAVESSASTFTPDISPLTLAAHMNNYEILKILLDRGATLPMPHDVRFVLYVPPRTCGVHFVGRVINVYVKRMRNNRITASL